MQRRRSLKNLCDTVGAGSGIAYHKDQTWGSDIDDQDASLPHRITHRVYKFKVREEGGVVHLDRRRTWSLGLFNTVTDHVDEGGCTSHSRHQMELES